MATKALENANEMILLHVAAKHSLRHAPLKGHSWTMNMAETGASPLNVQKNIYTEFEGLIVHKKVYVKGVKL